MDKRGLRLELSRLRDEKCLVEGQIEKLTEELRQIEAGEYIEEHGITLDQVWSATKAGCDVKNLPEMAIKAQFHAEPWTEWCGNIYKTENLRNRRFAPTCVLLRDLEAREMKAFAGCSRCR